MQYQTLTINIGLNREELKAESDLVPTRVKKLSESLHIQYMYSKPILSRAVEHGCNAKLVPGSNALHIQYKSHTYTVASTIAVRLAQGLSGDSD